MVLILIFFLFGLDYIVLFCSITVPIFNFYHKFDQFIPSNSISYRNPGECSTLTLAFLQRDRIFVVYDFVKMKYIFALTASVAVTQVDARLALKKNAPVEEMFFDRVLNRVINSCRFVLNTLCSFEIL